MYFFFVSLIICVAALTYMRYEAGRFKVNRIYFTNASNPLKVIHLSDIHLKYLCVDVDKVASVIIKEKPDFIILTGDYINHPHQINIFLSFLKEIKGNHRVFLCFGNHDYGTFSYNESKIMDFTRKIESIGVTVLHNKSVCLQKDSRKYNLIGIEDLRLRRYNVEKALSSCCEDAKVNIAISHNPDIVFKLPKDKVDYLLCGHFHGGQIWMPFGMEFKLMRRERLCKMGIVKGVNKVNDITLYINSGLGNVLFPLRFLSPPEIAIIYFP
ncbi:MAG: metallophosphoesterase [Clostridiaceae bacterium]|nr:metallophosphoesterase [Clostridiaceae bacterium]